MEKCDRTLTELNGHLSTGATLYSWNDDAAVSADYRFISEHDESEVIYSNAFKRLAGKSQMIIKPVRDHFRSRLSHTLEVRETALMMGRALGLNTALISAISLGHDLGHAPFGHAGEEALQRIASREVKNLIGITIAERELPLCFHHASNSARILALWLNQTDDQSSVTAATIRGALQHSWSPWKGSAVNPRKPPVFGIPTTYEAQIVAIADQVASINHDTEDLLEAHEYTQYTPDRFDREMTRRIGHYKKERGYGASEKKLLEGFFAPAISPQRERGYGRKSRIENAIEYVIENGRSVVNSHSPKEAAEYPIPNIGLFGEFLDLFENYIRDVLDEHTWFIGRNSMADAIVTTVFNHLWPTAQSCADVAKHEQISLEEEKKAKRARRAIKIYRDHYRNFYHESYKRPPRPYSLQDEFDYLTANLWLETREVWSTFLVDKCVGKLTNPAKKAERMKQLLAVIPLIHFVAGLTDRYCLEIFNATHSEFLST